MNKTKIEWVDYSWNPITGCDNGCEYCYARRMYRRFNRSFRPEFHSDRLDEPMKVKKPSRIFADSVGDFWSRGVKQLWRNRVWTVMKNTPQHTYFVLTKQPQRISVRDIHMIPVNCFIGVSVSVFDDRWRLKVLGGRDIKHTFVSLEPWLDDLYSEYLFLVDWIIVGGLTGRPNPFRPPKSVVDELVRECMNLKKPLFVKDNMGYPVGVQQFPSISCSHTCEGGK